MTRGASADPQIWRASQRTLPTWRPLALRPEGNLEGYGFSAQNLPQVHPRTPDRAVGLRQDVLVQQHKQPRTQRLVAPDVLKPLQHRRDVVPRLRVDPDLLDGHLTELELCSVNFSHDVNGAKIAKIVPKRVDPWEITPQEYDIWTIVATRNRRLDSVESTTCGFSAEH